MVEKNQVFKMKIHSDLGEMYDCVWVVDGCWA